ncbi:hypothetical protein ACFFWE_02140 [Sphaerisporangium melleum]|uniref:Mersacidin/lichenicidin family type 2 lantibiotic n=1 Tax=Sphaerisporangium melleum TaxID=321316 RepID=A0A917RLK1_9ACTN|nr:hypothetical protein [Sphaerisporangium melleum]GGL13249.1 hypothetical protein GCM10007964_64180 [Sphaerisporangium melleum]
MSENELIRQWKNPQARTADLLHPAGEIALDDAKVVAGAPPRTEYAFSLGCCPTGTWCGGL